MKIEVATKENRSDTPDEYAADTTVSSDNQKSGADTHDKYTVDMTVPSDDEKSGADAPDSADLQSVPIINFKT
jgi:hypothetical protein